MNALAVVAMPTRKAPASIALRLNLRATAIATGCCVCGVQVDLATVGRAVPGATVMPLLAHEDSCPAASDRVVEVALANGWAEWQNVVVELPSVAA